ncbi:TetR/AcrR family transcriptional regulator [Streptomyces boluensis]|uniref:TetR family transcriptional regulator n=1 Tax=Streptomyces boluensis TaxID=1775135 RepID=A0A964URR4_9ACTN|nr:TetR/AcrR family transcriptional regulator [Streptomyces boluensis]NBE54101.1 TetR family transcriptional regulator [Streptomyces boluensis]
MRADARHNRVRILRAARQACVDEGPGVPLEEIAGRAGVGIATLYRHFPSRAALIRAVAADVMEALYEAATDAAQRESDPFEALRRFTHTALDSKAAAVMPALFGRVEGGGLFDEERDAVGPLGRLIARARKAGLLRADVVTGDIVFMIVRLARPMPGAGFSQDEALAHRQLDIYLDGLRPPAAGPRRGGLPEPAISAGRVRHIRAWMATGGTATNFTSAYGS